MRWWEQVAIPFRFQRAVVRCKTVSIGNCEIISEQSAEPISRSDRAYPLAYRELTDSCWVGVFFRAKKSGTAECFQSLCLLQETKAFSFLPCRWLFPGKPSRRDCAFWAPAMRFHKNCSKTCADSWYLPECVKKNCKMASWMVHSI